MIQVCGRIYRRGEWCTGELCFVWASTELVDQLLAYGSVMTGRSFILLLRYVIRNPSPRCCRRLKTYDAFSREIRWKISVLLYDLEASACSFIKKVSGITNILGFCFISVHKHFSGYWVPQIGPITFIYGTEFTLWWAHCLSIYGSGPCKSVSPSLWFLWVRQFRKNL